MRNGLFGWNLPPGCSLRDVESLSCDSPCDVCGLMSDDCICPECPVCQSIGDPKCYDAHGLQRSMAQITSLTAHNQKE
jgi:hypothetical protein